MLEERKSLIKARARALGHLLLELSEHTEGWPKECLRDLAGHSQTLTNIVALAVDEETLARRMATVAVERGLITKQQLAEVAQQQARTGRPKLSERIAAFEEQTLARNGEE
jgi:hypothetical protein